MKIPKNLIIAAISISFLFTFVFAASCRGTEATGPAEADGEITEVIEETTEEEIDEPEVETEESVEEEAAPEVDISGYKIGEEIIVNDSASGNPLCSLIIHSVKNFTDFEEGREPFPGMRYVVLDMELKNLSEDNIEYSGTNYQLMDSEGNIYKKLGPNKEPVFISGTFLQDNVITGFKVVKVPEDAAIVAVVANPCYTDTIYIVLDPPLAQ